MTGDFTVDGTLSLTGASLNAIGCHPELVSGSQTLNQVQSDGCGVLFIQNSSLATLVDFFNGLVTIDNKGTLTAQTISATEYKATPGKSTGSGVILAGTKSVDIPTILTTPTSHILLTPTVETTQTLSVTAKVSGAKFTVTVPAPVTSDLPFDWFLVN